MRPRVSSCARADNEVIVNSRSINSNLPQAIAAFFFPTLEPQSASYVDGIYVDIVEAHARFLRSYGLSAAEVPLLRLNASDWETPLTVYEP